MRVVISAGGTGGHIYPALSIINKIKEKDPTSEFLYIGTHNRMEKDLIPELGINYISIKINGLKRKISIDNLKNVFNYFRAIKECKHIINNFKPDIVIGTGGYVTTPVIYSAKKLGYKTFIHEQNSDIGLSNKYLSKYADIIAVSFSSTLNSFDKKKVVLTGNPCGDRALSIKKVKKESLGFSDDKPLVLIVMGSLGSETVNNEIVGMLSKLGKKNYEVAFVTGNSYYNKIKSLKVPSNVKIFPYIYEMTSVMKATDLMVSRAGASTMSEIVSLNVPTIFIPSPYVANNHQYKNAFDLVQKEAGFLLEEKDLHEERLIKMIDEIINNKELISRVKKNLNAFKTPDSSGKIYDLIRKLVDNNG